MKFVYIIGCCLLVAVSSANATKKACLPYLEKLRNIQSQQRVGHSNNKGRTLAEKEAKARKKWWQCQHGKLTAKKTKAKNKKKKQSNKKKSPATEYAIKNNYSQSLTSTLVLKAKYQGKMQQAWLDFYQKPKRCIKPKSTQEFAFCIENEQEQQVEFEQKIQKLALN